MKRKRTFHNKRCINRDESCAFQYHDPICKRTGKMCTDKVTPCKYSQDELDFIVSQFDCIPNEQEG